ncbi:TPA: hypothetical protein DIS56_00425 [Candidatus Saccharibacteria bacterium]|nr:MAG: hypothetical protein UX30_C0002G0034 [Candidatus Saccharibacteria bacterium GW2011_GWA2_46_10]OGL35792.1 MAG: hypothetical protein A3F05_02030 [Candidatus Saccharibacteria bacterium RIFCSPHIGHO2_12_FULL_47_17]HCM51590.1 hypothetical protein [Candidatus Saccharibacteria bacterium]
MKTPRFEAPRVQGAFDPHPETPPTSGELNIADGDIGAVEQRARQAAERLIRAEPETLDERALRTQQLEILQNRYGHGNPTQK